MFQFIESGPVVDVVKRTIIRDIFPVGSAMKPWSVGATPDNSKKQG